VIGYSTVTTNFNQSLKMLLIHRGKTVKTIAGLYYYLFIPSGSDRF